MAFLSKTGVRRRRRRHRRAICLSLFLCLARSVFPSRRCSYAHYSCTAMMLGRCGVLRCDITDLYRYTERAPPPRATTTRRTINILQTTRGRY